MPSNIWTPAAVASECFRSRRRLWRAVEAQHIASTLRLVENAEEQLLLEKVLEASKPPLPGGTQGLHFLLASPFRYRSPIGSRFRSPADAGIWYGADAIRTACAELGFWRWRFLADSAGLGSLGPAPQTVFCASVDARTIDLGCAPFKRERSRWMNPNSYAETQNIARTAREAEVDVIRYESVRDPERGMSAAVLNPAVFAPRKPLEQQTWFLTVRAGTVTWQREGALHEFYFENDDLLPT